MERPLRIGVDFGGTKIEAAALTREVHIAARRRTANPGGYAAALRTVRELVEALESETGGQMSVGVGAPGSRNPRTGLQRNANSTWLNGQPFAADLEHALARAIRLANDADCFALSEARDGASDLLDPQTVKRNAAERASDKAQAKFGAKAVVKGRELRRCR